MTSTSLHTKPKQDRASFCARLRDHREQQSLSLDEIASETRIPMRSLQSLESGKFEQLPADVFVRGFLRSYARCVGLDADDTVRRYSALGFDAAPVASEMAAELLAQMKGQAATDEAAAPKRRMARGTSPEGEARKGFAAGRSGAEWLQRVVAKRNDAGKSKEDSAEPTRTKRVRARRTNVEEPPAPRRHDSMRAPERTQADHAEVRARGRVFLPRDFAGDETERRGNLTLAVIILVIVATITMSYLTRRPSHAGDGISMAPETTESTTAAVSTRAELS